MIRLRRTAILFGLSGFLVALTLELGSESVTMTTYYPAPSGVYNRLITTDVTSLASKGGAVVVGEDAPSSDVKVDVRGAIKLAAAAALPATGSAGSILFDSAKQRFIGHDGTAWRPLGTSTIVCRAARRFNPATQGGNYTIVFTAAECGGHLPDATYIGMAKMAKMCGGIAHFHALDVGESEGANNPTYRTPVNTGPGIMMHTSAAAPPCLWTDNPANMHAEAAVIYIKQ